MQRSDDNGRKPPKGSTSTGQGTTFEVMIDSDIVRAFQERWPDTWREKMAEALKRAADSL